jgi:hypothetical protein
MIEFLAICLVGLVMLGCFALLGTLVARGIKE